MPENKPGQDKPNQPRQNPSQNPNDRSNPSRPMQNPKDDKDKKW